MTRTDALAAAILAAITELSAVDFDTRAMNLIKTSGEDANADEIDARLRATQAINAGKFIKDAAKDADLTVDELRDIARRIFNGATAGRGLSPLARTIAMGHTLTALYQLGWAISDLQWSDVPDGMSLAQWEKENAA